MASNMKKDFQKVVAMFRDSLPDVHYINHWTKEENTARPQYPKAMLTSKQEMHRTATVNFGSGKDSARETAEKFTAYEPFQIWCESYGIHHVFTEINNDHWYQVRVQY